MGKTEKIANVIKNRVSEVVMLDQIEDGLSTLRLPLFLLSGDEVTISLKIDGENLILTNGMYKVLEGQLYYSTSSKDVINTYILDSKKFKASIEKNLTAHGINHSLNLKKIVKGFKSLSEEMLANIILQYSFAIIQHYGYIYHYSLVFAKEEVKGVSFKTAMDNFINKISKNYNIKPYESDEIIHDQHNYYNTDKMIFSGVRGKNALHEVLEDMSDLMANKKIEIKEGIILIDLTNNKELSNTYLVKMEKRLKKRNISYIVVENDNFKKFEERLKN